MIAEIGHFALWLSLAVALLARSRTDAAPATPSPTTDAQ